MTRVGEGVEKGKHLYTVGGTVNWYNHGGKDYVIPQNIKNRNTL